MLSMGFDKEYKMITEATNPNKRAHCIRLKTKKTVPVTRHNTPKTVPVMTTEVRAVCCTP